jgi:hypothetical protein
MSAARDCKKNWTEGTFQVLFLLPAAALRGRNPFLTMREGQYAIKNLVLIAASLVIGSTVWRRTKGNRLRA